MSASGSAADLRRRVPAVDELLRDPTFGALEDRHGRLALLHCLRQSLDAARLLATTGDAAALEAALAALPADVARRLTAAAQGSLVRVINATGVVLHTNLGRAPLPQEATARIAAIAASYSNLEYDLDSGERGHRELHAEERLRSLLRADAAVVVNNNAAAVLLAVNTLAEGREVIVSRGELVEIGGSFRIPDVLLKAGARLREVGTTNRTRISDYKNALTPETGAILRVHPSNFRIVGFTEATSLKDLVELAREVRLPLVEDLGGGLLTSLPRILGEEPSVQQSLGSGVDLVTFSGDKLLGGPQAGLAVGRRGVVDAMRQNALYRALRVDKLTIAALDAVLGLHQAGRAQQALPVLRMLALRPDEVRTRAVALRDRLRASRPDLEIDVIDGTSAVGGGAAPAQEVPTALLTLAHHGLGADRLVARLRQGSPPVVARVAEAKVVVDLRSVAPEEEDALYEAIVHATA
jgi:L-seryl-tRNA(Ser) seleniumtransferase